MTSIAKFSSCVGLLLVCACHGESASKERAAASTDAPAQSAASAASAASGIAPGKVLAPRPSDAELARVAQSCNAFGLSLWAETSQQISENLLLSPLSLFAALSLLRAGAAASTELELKQALHYEGSAENAVLGAKHAATSASDQVSIQLVARLFGERSHPFKPSYVALSDSLGAPLSLQDFKQAPEAARERINQFISQQTRGKVPDLLPAGSVAADTRLVLSNALAFSARWAEPFDPSRTDMQPFHVSAHESRDTKTLHRQGQFAFANTKGLKLLELPYAGAQHSMILVLPRPGDSIASLERQLKNGALDAWRRKLTPNTVEVSIPKFHLESPRSMALGRALAALGIKSAFDAASANFEPMNASANAEDRLSVAEVFQRSVVMLDENGTQAAAATGVVMQAAGAALPAANAQEFRADRPFLFFIVDKSDGGILFLGRVVDPSGG